MTKSGIKLLFCLVSLACLNQSCANLKFYGSTPTTPSRTTATKQTIPPKSKTTTPPKRSKSSYGIDKDEQVRTEIVEYAKQNLGIPYKYGGTTPRGFDCSGFTSHVMHEFNIDLHRTSKDQASQGKKVSLKEAKPGDLIFFSKGGRVFHVSIVTSNKNGKIQMIHSSSRGVVMDNLNSSKYWYPKVHSVKDVSRVRG